MGRENIGRGMKRRLLCLFVLSGVLWALAASTGTARSDTSPVQSGRVLAAGISGHGRNPAGKTSRARKGDLWWNYCISSQGQVYSAVSRESPAKSGLTTDARVRFSIDRNQIYVFGPNGRRHTLRILRQSKADACP